MQFALKGLNVVKSSNAYGHTTLNSTSSRPITEVKQRRGSVSTWMGDRLGTPGAVGNR